MKKIWPVAMGHHFEPPQIGHLLDGIEPKEEEGKWQRKRMKRIHPRWNGNIHVDIGNTGVE
jgi:hypothetical protein